MFGKKKETAKPMTKCIYPRCNECEHYFATPSQDGKPAIAGCDVPVVVTKQMYMDVMSFMDSLSDRVDSIDEYVTELHVAMKERVAKKKPAEKKSAKK